MDAREIMKELQKPFPANEIEWRVSRTVKSGNGYKAIVLAYVTNRAIQNRLDEIFTPFGWKNEFKEWRDKGTICGISVLWNNEWISKYDGADETNFEATKGGFSGSMKRAAVQFGIGRYLYHLDETWVDIKDKGDNYINAEVKVGQNKEWVKGYWNTPKLPDWALPEGEQKPKPIEQNTIGDIKKLWLLLGYKVGAINAQVKKSYGHEDITGMSEEEGQDFLSKLNETKRQVEQDPNKIAVAK